MTIIPEHYLSAYFLFGLLVVIAYAWQKFNEPTFPRGDTMPSTVDPLRHMFTQGSYRNARVAYVCASLLLYSALVWPGPSMVQLLGASTSRDLPAEAWALLVALFLVGLVPNSRIRWVLMVEEFLRRSVHSWYLVPARVEGTIGTLDDARYEPPASLLRALPNPLREKLDTLRNDLKGPPSSLEYRWARATFIFSLIKQIGVAAELPLKSVAFAPFSDDLKAIQEKFLMVQRDVAAFREQPRNDVAEEDLKSAIGILLKRMYAYISWGLGNQEKNEQDIDEVFQQIGFKIPRRSPHRPIDILGPAIGIVALITMLFWLIVGSLHGIPTHRSAIIGFQAAVAAFFMYGAAVYIALNARTRLIRDRNWYEGSPKSLLSISLKAGLATWIIIAISTAILSPDNTWSSLTGLAEWIGSLARYTTPQIDFQAVSYLPKKISTASPWFFVGAAASVLVFIRFSGDVRARGSNKRYLDAAFVAVGLGAFVYLAQLIQGSLENMQNIAIFSLTVGLAGMACGAVLGFFVPNAFRTSIFNPYDRHASKVLDDLLGKAEKSLGSKDDAEGWVFGPHKDLGGITPAEALQHKSLATGVYALLDLSVSRLHEDELPTKIKPMPTIIEGGLARA